VSNFYISATNVRGGEKTYGPFSYIQITYDVLRVQHVGGQMDGEFDDKFAIYDPTCQENNPTKLSTSPDGWVFNDGFIASDLTFFLK
jgi:hypothetical protein